MRSVLAILIMYLLLQVGVPCKVFERESGPRKGGSAIGLWPNAFRALDALGVADHLREQHPLISRQADQRLPTLQSTGSAYTII